MEMKKEAELRVLRHLANKGKEMIPEGMEKYECIAACERLEEKKCVRVAWLEGHDFEHIKILPSGRVYLQELEKEEKSELSELERLRIENAELKAKIKQLSTIGIPIIFNDNLDYTKIKTELEKVDKFGLGPKQFALAVKEFFKSINWLIISKNSAFVKWMKLQGLISDCEENLSHVKHNKKMDELNTCLKKIFQFENNRGLWEDKEQFYKKDRIKINQGK